MENEEEAKYFGFLQKLSRREFFDDKDVTDESLKSEYYPDVSPDEFDHLIQLMSRLIKTMSSSNMDFNQTEAFLTSQTKRKEGKISTSQAKTLAKFWRSQRSEIHDAVAERSATMPTLKNVSWRTDVQNGTPNAIIEVVTKAQQKGATETFLLETDEKGLARMLQSMDDIAAQISLMSKT